ncbi:1-acyl-sn-glycerol-3-phosphate acyltransferase [candidate division KSB1 bacterium]|nr:1-acyl-sn-glycerol-3-phosphate acyltransferase [candidate division KSB1 bacterium]
MTHVRSILIYLIGIPIFLLLAGITIVLSILGGSYRFDPLIKFFCRLILGIFGIRVDRIMNGHLDPKRTYLFMCNHVNMFDSFVLNGYLPNLTRGVELDSHFRWPIWGTVIRKFGNIPISHHNTKSAIESLKQAQAALEDGTSIIILPEGHRTRDGKLRTFMKGPFHLAKNACATIVPLAMVGAFEIKQVQSLLLRPGTVHFRIGEPIPYDNYQHMKVNELRDLIREKIEQLMVV